MTTHYELNRFGELVEIVNSPLPEDETLPVSMLEMMYIEHYLVNYAKEDELVVDYQEIKHIYVSYSLEELITCHLVH